MAKRLYQHNVYVENYSRLDSTRLKALKEGTIVNFSYDGDNISDKKPLVLMLWNDYKNYKMHGINLNYLTHKQVVDIFRRISRQGVSIDSSFESDEYDESSKYRNLVRDPYSRIMLPTYGEPSTGNLGKQEAIQRMENLYNKTLKPFLKKEDVYRTYTNKKIRTLSVVELNFNKMMR